MQYLFRVRKLKRIPRIKRKTAYKYAEPGLIFPEGRTRFGLLTESIGRSKKSLITYPAPAMIVADKMAKITL